MRILPNAAATVNEDTSAFDKLHNFAMTYLNFRDVYIYSKRIEQVTQPLHDKTRSHVVAVKSSFRPNTFVIPEGFYLLLCGQTQCKKRSSTFCVYKTPKFRALMLMGGTFWLLCAN